MKLIKLTASNNQAVWINPEYISMMTTESSANDSETITKIWLSGDPNNIEILESIRGVILTIKERKEI